MGQRRRQIGRRKAERNMGRKKSAEMEGESYPQLLCRSGQRRRKGSGVFATIAIRLNISNEVESKHTTLHLCRRGRQPRLRSLHCATARFIAGRHSYRCFLPPNEGSNNGEPCLHGMSRTINRFIVGRRPIRRFHQAIAGSNIGKHCLHGQQCATACFIKGRRRLRLLHPPNEGSNNGEPRLHCLLHATTRFIAGRQSLSRFHPSIDGNNGKLRLHGLHCAIGHFSDEKPWPHCQQLTTARLVVWQHHLHLHGHRSMRQQHSNEKE